MLAVGLSGESGGSGAEHDATSSRELLRIRSHVNGRVMVVSS
jgi:hypothetical protein